jgi:hypothetical protein
VPTGEQCSSIQAIGGTESTSEDISAYPKKRPDSSNAKINVTSPFYASEGILTGNNFEGFTKNLDILDLNSPKTLQLDFAGVCRIYSFSGFFNVLYRGSLH